MENPDSSIPPFYIIHIENANDKNSKRTKIEIKEGYKIVMTFTPNDNLDLEKRSFVLFDASGKELMNQFSFVLSDETSKSLRPKGKGGRISDNGLVSNLKQIKRNKSLKHIRRRHDTQNSLQ